MSRPPRLTSEAPVLGVIDVVDDASGVKYSQTVRSATVLAASQTRILEFLLGVSFPFWRVVAVPGIPNEIPLMGLAVAICVFVKPTRRVVGLQFVGLAYAAMLAHVIVISTIFGQAWLQRSFRMTLLFMFMLMIAEGRLHWKSMVAGMVAGMVLINAPAYYLGLTPDRYPPFLTGFVGDKNVAGMYHAVLALLGLSLFAQWRTRLLYVALLSGLTWLTGSRTSIMAAAIGLAWYFMRPRFRWARLVAAAVVIQLLALVETRFARVGVFEDREGTDLLRSQIDAATTTLVQNTQWYGRGLNTAWVSVPNFPHMAFHNSYAALWVEGGLVMGGIVLILLVGVGMGFVSADRKIEPDRRAAEAAMVVILVCAWKLGEVFFTAPCFIILGILIHQRIGTPAVSTKVRP